ncbi:hypothetical protein Hamer_G024376 [Homarus americanus]|uniref:Uncharacterized protein n=1 Tax=Homarus americanus TaxID=6706 RepID=A0A8J5ML25_HOMAM|nr:hypothetical protein Hamer_G024376 [Homarus americanus]
MGTELCLFQTSVSTEYWTCSECTCDTSGTYHTCPECQELQDLFTHDDTRPPSEADLPLDEILKRRSRSRTKSGSKGKDDLAKAEAKRQSRSRSRSRSTPRVVDDTDAAATTTPTPTTPTPTTPTSTTATPTTAAATSTIPAATKVKREPPQDHPDAIERATRSRSRSRSKSLTREIVASFKEFRDKVTRGRSRSKSGDRLKAEEDEGVPGFHATVDHSREGLANGDVHIHVQVEPQPQEAAPPPPKPGKAWKEVSSETVTTRLVLHGGDTQGDRTLTLEQVTSIRKPDKTQESQTLRDAFRWKSPPSSSAADSSTQRPSTSAQPQSTATETFGRAFTPTESSQLTHTPVLTPSVLSAVPAALHHATLLVEASPFGLPFSTSSTSAVAPSPQDANEDASVAQISQVSPSVEQHGVCESVSPPDEVWPLPPDEPPPEEPTLIQVRPMESSSLTDIDSKLVLPAQTLPVSKAEASPPPCPAVEEEELPPPRPPTPVLEVDEVPPPRPPGPIEVYEDSLLKDNNVPVHEITPPRPLPPTIHEMTPPRPVPPASDDALMEELYVCAPPRPDPPSDDADDEREATPPRPQPPLQYEIGIPPRPPLPTIHEFSPPLHEGSPLLEELSENKKTEVTPPRPRAPIITQFTPPRPTEADTVTLPSLPLPPPPAESQHQMRLVPLEAAPEHSSPSDHPYTSSSPEKSGTSPDKESDADARTAPLTVPRSVAGGDMTDQRSRQPLGLPPPFPHPKADEDDMIRKMRKVTGY